MLLLSTYELGRQPVHVASPAAALRVAGHDVRALDLSVDPWDADLVAWAEAVAISVPMHTAMRLGVRVAERLRAQRPDLPVAFYGLYAPVSRDLTVGRLADRLMAGEYEPALVAWADELAGPPPASPAGPTPASPAGPTPAPPPGAVVVRLDRSPFVVPDRSILPPLDRYAHLAVGGEHRLVGAVEASHGCNHRCRHCPVPAVYDGRTRVVDPDVVLADVAQLVDLGARHVTFGDPDFLSGPHHAMRVARALHAAFPELTFDVTVKVEHILRHEGVWPELAAAGCLFVVTAVECLDPHILRLLDKGHTPADAERAMVLLRQHGIDPHPSFLAFTPWTTAAGLLDILDFVARHDLVPVVDPVQYTLRLLVPEGSLFLDVPELSPFLDAYDPDGLTWRWRAADPRLDALQGELTRIVEAGVAAGDAPHDLYAQVRERVAVAAGQPERATPPVAVAAGSIEGRPRLTEPWFC